MQKRVTKHSATVNACLDTYLKRVFVTNIISLHVRRGYEDQKENQRIRQTLLAHISAVGRLLVSFSESSSLTFFFLISLSSLSSKHVLCYQIHTCEHSTERFLVIIMKSSWLQNFLPRVCLEWHGSLSYLWYQVILDLPLDVEYICNRNSIPALWFLNSYKIDNVTRFKTTDSAARDSQLSKTISKCWFIIFNFKSYMNVLVIK